MSPEDAERYIKYCDECEKGIHNNHPGLDEQQYLDDFSYEEHFAGRGIEGITTKDPSGIKNQGISYASFEGDLKMLFLLRLERLLEKREICTMHII